ncbi:MAG: ABC transporter ATP-binding protein [Victivallaceae bacterium]|nr:ABC transporter ATP-binding protein [Victivallaceae bacterium]
MAEKEIYLEVSNIHKSYQIGKKPISVLRGVNMCVARGSWTSLLGASGSGKTTLLNILGLLERPDHGEVVCGGTRHSALGQRQAGYFRNRRIGFIFQAYHMMPELNILENVMLPGRLNSPASSDLRERAEDLLDKMGLSSRLKHRPAELSGGEQQRAAIARALINSPELILADEPTGNLDSKTGNGILDIFLALHHQPTAPTIIMITHNHEVATLGDNILHLKDGILMELTDNVTA